MDQGLREVKKKVAPPRPAPTPLANFWSERGTGFRGPGGTLTRWHAQWCRHRGDIFDLWQQGHDALESFTEHINSLYPTVKFELVYSENKLNVLDVTASFILWFYSNWRLL